jgi:hypothetical protein
MSAGWRAGQRKRPAVSKPPGRLHVLLVMSRHRGAPTSRSRSGPPSGQPPSRHQPASQGRTAAAGGDRPPHRHTEQDRNHSRPCRADLRTGRRRAHERCGEHRNKRRLHRTAGGLERATAEARTGEGLAELRKALRSVDEALAITRPERVHTILDASTGSGLGQLLRAPPEKLEGRAAWCGIAYRLETALDDPGRAARLAWSNDPLDRLIRGLLDAEPAAVTAAQDIIAGAVGIASETRINLADPAAWEQAARAGSQAARLAHVIRGQEAVSGLGL